MQSPRTYLISPDKGLRQLVQQFLPPIVVGAIRRSFNRLALRRYLQEAVPWSSGYEIYKREFLANALSDQALLKCFGSTNPLPLGYGVGLDERCVEYPWAMAHLSNEPGTLLDAGSTLNHAYILGNAGLLKKDIYILTLAPEDNCFWGNGISYLFCDLRSIPIRDDFYDWCICLSTLEHIGCDNTVYGSSASHCADSGQEVSLAMQELHRVLKPGGTLLLSVPFGVPRHFGTFQQLDRKSLSSAVSIFQATKITETFYRYTADGWNVATAEECAACDYVQWDGPMKSSSSEAGLAAAASAVACVQLVK
jgi:SAM-dependent methyltransferase